MDGLATTWPVLWFGLTPVLGVGVAAVIPGRLTWPRGLLGAVAAQLAASAAILHWGSSLFVDPATGARIAPPATPEEWYLFLLFPLPWALVEGALATAVVRYLGERVGRRAPPRGGVLYERGASEREMSAGGALPRGQGRPGRPRAQGRDAVRGGVPSRLLLAVQLASYAAWQDYRRRWILLIAVLAGCYLLLRSEVAAVLDAVLGFDGAARVFGYVGLPALVFALGRLISWRCPRCGLPYATHGRYGGGGNLFTRQCVHCGLPRWAESDPPEAATILSERPGEPVPLERRIVVQERERADAAADLAARPPAPRTDDTMTAGDATGHPAEQPTGTCLCEGSSVRVVRLPARDSRTSTAAPAPRVDDLGIIVQVRVHATGRRSYVVMSGDPSAAEAWWAEFTADELAPV